MMKVSTSGVVAIGKRRRCDAYHGMLDTDMSDGATPAVQLVIDTRESLVAAVGHLYLSTKFSDYTVIVDGQSMPCHKVVLATQSDFFDRLLESQMSESLDSEVVLKDTDPELFRVLLRLTYTGRLDLTTIDTVDVVKLFGLIQRYQFTSFETPLLAKIKSMVNASNVWPILQTSMDFHLTDCQSVCFEFLDSIVDIKTVINEDFFDISVDTLRTLLSRNSLHIPEVDLFEMTKKYIEVNRLGDNNADQLIQCIRLSLMRYEDLWNHVSDSGLVSEQRLKAIMKDKAVINADNWSQMIVNRALVVENINICSDKYSFEVLTGRVGNVTAAATDQSSATEWPVAVRFGFPMNTNQIDLKLSDLRGDRFSYIIQYSLEGLDWETLYDYTKYTTSNFQQLFFDPIVAQHFRIGGTHQFRMDATSKSTFDCIESFACYFRPKQLGVERVDGLLTTPYWIRSIQQRVYHDSAVIGHNDSADKYYSREITSNKPIIVALDQPVMIDSFEMYLWDGDDRAYSYVVETKDGDNWVILADKSNDVCRSLQTIAFSRRPISLTRVRGVKIHFSDCNQFRVIKFNFPKIY